MAKAERLSRFGFNFEVGSTHSARTMMLRELQCLFSVVERDEAVKSDYLKAIKDDNCLSKRSVITRNITARYLVVLYALDPSVTLFRVLLYFWKRDADGQPLLALLCAYSRDPLLRASAEFLSCFSEGAVVSRKDLEEFIDTADFRSLITALLYT